MSDDDPWELLIVDGVLVKRRPWCDCRKKGWGYRKREDGCWVRPCCNRRTETAWRKRGNEPIAADALLNQEQGRSQCEQTSHRQAVGDKEGTT